MIYRFKIKFEEDDDFIGIVEVNVKQSVFHFHDIMQKALGFNKKQPAALYTSNDNWKPLKEIEIPADYLDIIEKESKLPSLSQYIIDPYQKFIYMADKENEWILEVELMRIAESNSKHTYPRIVRIEGVPPRQFIADPIIDDEDSSAGLDIDLSMPPQQSQSSLENKADSIDLNLEDFPDIGNIDEIDFSEEVDE